MSKCRVFIYVALGMFFLSLASVAATDFSIETILNSPTNNSATLDTSILFNFTSRILATNASILYDLHDDASINASLWSTSTGGPGTVVESARGLEAECTGTSCTATASSLNMTGIANITSVRINATLFISSTGGGLASSWGFGGTVESRTTTGTTTGIYIFTRLNSTTFNVTRDGTFLKLHQPSTSVLSLSASATSAGGSNSEAIFDFEYYSTSENFTFSNSTISVWYSNGTLFNETTITVSGNETNNSILNISEFLIGRYKWNTNTCANNGTVTLCALQSTNNTFVQGIGGVTQSLVSNVFETETQVFNVTFNVTSGTPSGNLWHNGTKYSGSSSNIDGDQWRLSRTLQIPIGSGIKSVFWEIISGSLSYNASAQSQTVSTINLSYCGEAGGNVPYLNFTFKDESTDLDLNASNDLSDFTYWLGDGSINKSFIVTNTTENPSYAFCFSPPSEDLTVDLTFKYSGSGYPIRTFQLDDQTLTNATTDQVLYLLGSSDGIYSSIQTNEVTGTPIPGVTMTVERQFGGLWVVVGVAVGGSDGIATFWVNPNFDHRITGIKAGYVNTQVIIAPSQSLYTLVMTRTTGDAEFSGSTEGMSWKTSPPSGYLAPGEYYFTFNLSTSLNNLDGGFCKFELVNSTQDIVASTTGGNSSNCNLGITYTHLASERIFGKLYVDTTNTTGYILIDSDQRWTDIEGTDVSTWSTIFSFFTELKDLDEWGDGSHRQEWNRTVAFFLFLTIGVGIFSFFTQWDSQYPGVAVIMVFSVIMMASFSGWFNVGNSALIVAGYEKLDKYIIAMLTASLSVAWYTGYLRRTT